MENFKRVAVLGAGSWGTALALLLHGNGHSPVLWGRNAVLLEQMRSSGGTPFLPEIAIPQDLQLSAHLENAVGGADLVVLAVPSAAIRETCRRLALIELAENAVILSCTKGLERGTGFRMSEIVAEAVPGKAVAALSGPSHAEEVARHRPTAVVLGCSDQKIGGALQRAFSSRSFRAYTSDDLAGIELGGALKNVFALAAGVGDGLGLGDNSKAALVTRGLAELMRLGAALGGRRETFQGLSGVGDLLVTCFSRHSRNRLFGERLARGESAGEIAASMLMVAEGVPTATSAWESARRHGVETPIIEQIRALLNGEVSAAAAMDALLSRELRPE